MANVGFDGPLPALDEIPRPKLDSNEFDCERGRDVEDAIFGREETLLRVPPPAEPEARFRFFITSVFKDKGRTTPCNL